MEDPRIVARVVEALRNRGLGPERVQFLGHSPPAHHLKSYQAIDIALDPFPYSGAVTTLEALWMGVPVVTMPADTFTSRHGMGHLTNVRQTEWVARDPEDYGRIVDVLIRSIREIRTNRRGLREDLSRSPLMDHEAFARHFLIVLEHARKTHRESSRSGPR